MKGSLVVLSMLMLVGGCATRSHNEGSAVMGAGENVSITPSSGASIHFFVDATAYKVDANFERFNGTLTKTDGAVTAVKFEVETNSVKTKSYEVKIEGANHDSSRDAALCGGTFFACVANPKATFESTQITPTSGGYSMKGNLTIKGKTKLIIMKVKEEGGMYVGKATLDRRDFDLNGGAPGFLKSAGAVISDAVDLEVKVPK